MKEFNPKPDLWSKIQQRKSFDSQVKNHVPNLPERLPKADLWNSIESELDQKAPVVLLWRYAIAAASIALIFALSGIVYLEFDPKEVKTLLTTKISTHFTEPNALEEAKSKETKPAIEITDQIESKKIVTSSPQSNTTKREVIAPIDVPKTNLTDLSFENSIVSVLIIPETPEIQTATTQHKVRISWGIQDKGKLRTTFGAGAPEEISDQYIGRADQSPNSIKIRFKKQ